jgi:hypothetical protein
VAIYIESVSLGGICEWNSGPSGDSSSVSLNWCCYEPNMTPNQYGVLYAVAPFTSDPFNLPPFRNVTKLFLGFQNSHGWGDLFHYYITLPHRVFEVDTLAGAFDCDTLKTDNVCVELCNPNSHPHENNYDTIVKAVLSFIYLAIIVVTFLLCPCCCKSQLFTERFSSSSWKEFLFLFPGGPLVLRYKYQIPFSVMKKATEVYSIQVKLLAFTYFGALIPLISFTILGGSLIGLIASLLAWIQVFRVMLWPLFFHPFFQRFKIVRKCFAGI